LGAKATNAGGWWRVPELTEKFAVGSPLTATVLLTLEESAGGAAKRLGDAAAGALEATAA